MTYGNFYYGKDGFFFKKNNTIGVKWNPKIGLICNQPQNINNKYVSGSGVGAKSTSIRRYEINRASHYYPSSTNGECFTRLGLYSKYNTGLSTYSFNWYLNT
jgi:hypothetical protein